MKEGSVIPNRRFGKCWFKRGDRWSRSASRCCLPNMQGTELLLIIGKELIFTGDSSGGSRRAYFWNERKVQV